MVWSQHKYNVFYISLYHNPQFHNFLPCRILKNFEDFVLVEGFHIERRLSPLVENWWSHGIIMHHLSTKLILQRILENCEIVPPTQLFPTIPRNLENAHFNEKKRAFRGGGAINLSWFKQLAHHHIIFIIIGDQLLKFSIHNHLKSSSIESFLKWSFPSSSLLLFTRPMLLLSWAF